MALSSCKHIQLGNGSELLYFEKFLDVNEARTFLEKLDKEIPWMRPTLSVYGRKCEQPRETCYVADKGLPLYKYSGFQPIVHTWEEFPTLGVLADAVHNALPGCQFNSVLINRYASGNDYAAWHADDEKLYGLTPTIASLSLGAEREFLLRQKRTKHTASAFHESTPLDVPLSDTTKHRLADTSVTASYSTNMKDMDAFDVLLSNSKHFSKVLKRKSCPTLAKDVNSPGDGLQSFILRNGSLFVMKGYTQRDWEHSVPKRKRVHGLRINLTFRRIIYES